MLYIFWIPVLYQVKWFTKTFFPINGLSVNYLTNVFSESRSFIYDEIQLLNNFCYFRVVLVFYLRDLGLIYSHKNVLMFSPWNFILPGFTFCLFYQLLREGHWNLLKMHIMPQWCGSVDWVPAWEPKGCRLDTQSGHMPGLPARSPVGSAWEAMTHWYFSPSLSPSPPLSKNNKIFLQLHIISLCYSIM